MQPLPLSILLLSTVGACALPALYRLVAHLESRVPAPQPSAPVEATQAPTQPFVPSLSIIPGGIQDPELERRMVMEWQLEHGLEPTGIMPALDDEDNGPLSPIVVYPQVSQIR